MKNVTSTFENNSISSCEKSQFDIHVGTYITSEVTGFPPRVFVTLTLPIYLISLTTCLIALQFLQKNQKPFVVACVQSDMKREDLDSSATYRLNHSTDVISTQNRFSQKSVKGIRMRRITNRCTPEFYMYLQGGPSKTKWDVYLEKSCLRKDRSVFNTQGASVYHILICQTSLVGTI